MASRTSCFSILQGPVLSGALVMLQRLVPLRWAVCTSSVVCVLGPAEGDLRGAEKETGRGLVARGGSQAPS